MKRIDLNCDIGEGFGVYRIGEGHLLEEELMNHVSSVNIACGFHAGDAATMRLTVQMALKHGVAIGAHPGLPDLQGFGRREMNITAQEAYEMTVYQLGALMAIAKSEGGLVQHVKPHGALYNMAACSPALAEAIAQAVYNVDERLVLYGLAGSELIVAANKTGLRSASEVFADRRYTSEGALVARGIEGAVIEEKEAAVAQALQLALHAATLAMDGTKLELQADTICIHSDTAGAAEYALILRSELEKAGIAIASPLSAIG